MKQTAGIAMGADQTLWVTGTQESKMFNFDQAGNLLGSFDLVVPSFNPLFLTIPLTGGEDIGTNYCGPANFNSSGQRAVISVFGSTEENATVVLTGNPYLGLDDDHEFVRIFAQADPTWHRIKVSALTDEQVIERGGKADELQYSRVFDRVPRKLLPEAQIEDYLRDMELTDPLVLSDVLGRFSPGSIQSLCIPRHILEGALAVTEMPTR